MKLFERFDEVFCINLDRRPDRLQKFDAQVNKYNLGKYTRVSAVDGKSLPQELKSHKLLEGEIGLILTVENIIESAIEKNFDSILIVEDDCYFTDEIEKIKTYFELLPKNWDMLYMGGNHNTNSTIHSFNFINNKIIKITNTFTTHFVGLKSTVFKPIVELTKQRHKALDVMYCDLQKKMNAYSFYPAIAKQLSDFSDIQNRTVNYELLIK